MSAADDLMFVDSDLVIEWVLTPDSGHSSLSDITLEIKPPGVAAVFATVTAPATDNYKAIYKPTLAGTYHGFWKSAGTIKHAKGFTFPVRGKGF